MLAVLTAIQEAAQIAGLVAQIGGDAAPFLALIAKWAGGSEQPTRADFDDLHAKKQVYLDMLNDTSKDTA